MLFFIWQPLWGLKKYQYKTVKCCLNVYLHIKEYWSEIYNIYSMITSYKWLIKKNIIKIKYCFMAIYGFSVIWLSCFACLSWLMLFLRTWWMAKTMNNVSFYCCILSVFTYVYCYTFPGFQDEMEEARTATQNALLKQLLANSLAMGGARPAGTPFSEVCCLFC